MKGTSERKGCPEEVKIAFAVSTEDAAAPARIRQSFAKKSSDLEIEAGVVEGNYYDAEGMKQNRDPTKQRSIFFPNYLESCSPPYILTPHNS